MYEISADTHDFVNNKAAMQRISDNGLGTLDILGGQDAVEVWLTSVANVNPKYQTKMDSVIMDYLVSASSYYNEGSFNNANEALQWVEDNLN
jgi:hypothetical protein